MAHVPSLAGRPAAVPTLDEVSSNPERATTLPPGVLLALIYRCATLQTALLGALAAGANTNGAERREPDSLIDVTAAAKLLGMSPDWLYRHAQRLPFTVRQGRRLLFSSRGIGEFIRRRQGV